MHTAAVHVGWRRILVPRPSWRVHPVPALTGIILDTHLTRATPLLRVVIILGRLQCAVQGCTAPGGLCITRRKALSVGRLLAGSSVGASAGIGHGARFHVPAMVLAVLNHQLPEALRVALFGYRSCSVDKLVLGFAEVQGALPVSGESTFFGIGIDVGRIRADQVFVVSKNKAHAMRSIVAKVRTVGGAIAALPRARRVVVRVVARHTRFPAAVTRTHVRKPRD